MQGSRRFDYFRYMDTWVILVPLVCFVGGAFLLAVPAIFKVEALWKDIVIAVGGLLAGQITIMISEIPKAKERALETRQLTVSAFLVGVNIGWLSLVADSQKKIPGRPNFLGKASAHFRTPGISEEAFNKLSGAQVTHSESLKAAQFLCDFYEGSIGASHPLLLPVY